MRRRWFEVLMLIGLVAVVLRWSPEPEPPPQTPQTPQTPRRSAAPRLSVAPAPTRTPRRSRPAEIQCERPLAPISPFDPQLGPLHIFGVRTGMDRREAESELDQRGFVPSEVIGPDHHSVYRDNDRGYVEIHWGADGRVLSVNSGFLHQGDQTVLWWGDTAHSVRAVLGNVPPLADKPSYWRYYYSLASYPDLNLTVEFFRLGKLEPRHLRTVWLGGPFCPGPHCQAPSVELASQSWSTRR